MKNNLAGIHTRYWRCRGNHLSEWWWDGWAVEGVGVRCGRGYGVGAPKPSHAGGLRCRDCQFVGVRLRRRRTYDLALSFNEKWRFRFGLHDVARVFLQSSFSLGASHVTNAKTNKRKKARATAREVNDRRPPRLRRESTRELKQ